MHHITTRTIADVHGRRGGLLYYVWRGGLLYYVYYATRLRGGDVSTVRSLVVRTIRLGSGSRLLF